MPLINRVNTTGNISSTIKNGNNNQANAASISMGGSMAVKGRVVNEVENTGNISSSVEGGNNNQANAGFHCH